MLIVHIQIHVKPESIAEFIQATVENAKARQGAREKSSVGCALVEPCASNLPLRHASSSVNAQPPRFLSWLAASALGRLW